MNQEELTTSNPTMTSTKATAGGLLRGLRDQSGMSVDTLAGALHVPAAKLEALEDNRLEALPDVMFARALAMAYCRYFKTDTAAVLALLPGQDVSRFAPKSERGIDSPLHHMSYSPAGLRFSRASMTPLRWGAVAALLLAMAVAFWPQGASKEDSTVAVDATAGQPAPANNPQDAASADQAAAQIAAQSASAGMVLTAVQPAAQTLPATVTPVNGSGARDGR